MAKKNNNTHKMQTIKITLSNGSSGLFIGKAIAGLDEMENISLEGFGIYPPEDVTDDIRQKIMNQFDEDE